METLIPIINTENNLLKLLYFTEVNGFVNYITLVAIDYINKTMSYQ